MGAVYLAVDEALLSEVALKMKSFLVFRMMSGGTPAKVSPARNSQSVRVGETKASRSGSGYQGS